MALRAALSKKRSKHPSDGTAGKKPFDIHTFLRDLKIVVVELGTIAILAIWLWHEAAHAVIAK